jgi:hypothetical protein
MIKGHMYAMLDFASLPPFLWGEAALTICYLFNQTELCALSPRKTLYEMLHGKKPNISHLHIFSTCCFAHIPPKLQEKLGPHSCEAIFMGYPPGVKAWWCHDATTDSFFNLRDVIFDKNLSNCNFTESDDDDEDEPVAPAPPPPPPAPPLIVPAPPHVNIIHQSGRIPVPTEKGQALKDRLASEKACLTHQYDLHAAHINGVLPPHPVLDTAPADIVPVPTHMPDPPSLPPADPDVILPEDEEVGFSQVIASLITAEVMCLSVQNDICQNPHAPGYDLKVPPATYDEAMCHPNCDHWLVAMHKEMNLMSEMQVYELVPLPNDHHVISCHWVIEFKDDLKGGPMFKARLVAQGFSQIAGVDFG